MLVYSKRQPTWHGSLWADGFASKGYNLVFTWRAERVTARASHPTPLIARWRTAETTPPALR